MAKKKKRPFTNLYYGTHTAPEDAYVAQGHAASERGAIRASVVRVFLNQYAMTRVFHEGVKIYTIHHTKRGMQISYGSSVRSAQGAPHHEHVHH